MSRKILFSILSLGLVVATFFFDQHVDAQVFEVPVAPVQVMEKGADSQVTQNKNIYQLSAGKTARLTVVLFENAVVRIAPDSAVTLEISSKNNQPNVTLMHARGRFWINSLASIVTIELKAGDVAAVMEPGVFDIQSDADVLGFSAYRRSMMVSILGNQLIVPEQRQMILSQSKIARSKDLIEKLRYSKLFKEFPFRTIEASDAWVTFSHTSDEQFLNEYSAVRFAQIREKGPVIGFDQDSLIATLDEIAAEVANTLTFDADKKNMNRMHRMFEYADSALHAFLIGKNEDADVRMSQFRSAAYENNFNDAAFNTALYNYLQKLAYVQPDDTLFPVKLELRDYAAKNIFSQMHNYLNDVLDISHQRVDKETQGNVALSLRRLSSFVQKAATAVTDANTAQTAFFESIRLNDFFILHPEFLSEEFLKIASMLERSYIKILVAKETSDDDRQFFVSEKLKRITLVRTLLEKNTIPFADARDALLLLVKEINDLKPSISDAAVNEYFDQQLTELQPLVSFLKSSRGQQLHGSFAGEYESFQRDARVVQKVQEILKNASGGVEVMPYRREELARIVLEDLDAIGIEKIQITLPDADDDPRVAIVSSTFESKKVSGVYDTVRKVFQDIVFDDKKIENAIRLQNLRTFFLVKLNKLQLGSGISADSLTEAQSPQSIVEKVAKATLIEELKRLDVVAEEKYLGMENFNDGIIHVRLASLGEGADAKVFSFDFDQKKNTVHGLKVQTVGGEIPVNDEFAFRELALKVDQIFKRAQFEQQREQELKDFVDTGEVKKLGPPPAE